MAFNTAPQTAEPRLASGRSRIDERRMEHGSLPPVRETRRHACLTPLRARLSLALNPPCGQHCFGKCLKRRSLAGAETGGAALAKGRWSTSTGQRERPPRRDLSGPRPGAAEMPMTTGARPHPRSHANRGAGRRCPRVPSPRAKLPPFGPPPRRYGTCIRQPQPIPGSTPGPRATASPRQRCDRHPTPTSHPCRNQED